MRCVAYAAGALLLSFGLAAPGIAEVEKVLITYQPGLTYMPLILAGKNKLIQKHAAAAGLSNVTVDWIRLTSGGATVEALVTGNVDVATSGATNLLAAWDRTQGQVKGLAASGGAPMLLVTRNPDVKTLADFSDKDRIAVPTLKVSVQAVMLQIAAARQLGEDNRHKLDPLTTRLSHPDAVGAVLSADNEVNSHFPLPPFAQMELKDPRVHVVLNSHDIVGGPYTNIVVFSRRQFVDENPKIAQAIVAALDEADRLIQEDPKKAAELYLAETREKLTINELLEMMKQPGVVFSTTPSGTMLMAEQMAKGGVIKTSPKDWKEFFFPFVHGQPGN
jgi:NitT/TauT family transport system substrate-binding protein